MQNLLMRAVCTALLAIFAAGLGGCAKNEFTLEGDLEGAGTQPLHIAYRAANSERAFVTDLTVPLMEGRFSLTCATRYPTVVWLFSPMHSLMYAVYAEKGDHISIKGRWTDPYTWQVSGNEVMEEYCAWAKANPAALHSTQPAVVNTAVARYVKAHPDTRTALFMLLTLYCRAEDEAGFRSLLATFKDKEMRAEMLAACAEPEPAPLDAKKPVSAFTLTNEKDTAQTLNPASARRTVLYFWREGFGPQHEQAMRLLREARRQGGVQAAHIYLDPDTVRWHQMLRSARSAGQLPDSVAALWAVGGESDPRLASLQLRSAPAIIVTDAKGRVLYRGTDVAAARTTVNKE